MIDYNGDDITIEEMHQGCVINSKGGEVVISSPRDAVALRDSLNLMINQMIIDGIICKICLLPMIGRHDLEKHHEQWDDTYG